VGLSYSVLGPLEVHNGEHLVPLTRAKDRVLLATLLIHANQVVSTDRLLDVLWGESPPPSGLKALQFHVSSLRNVLSPQRTGAASTCLRTQPPGYQLEVANRDIDAHRFRRLVDDARRVLSYDPAEAHRWLTEALSLWRGPAYGEFAYTGFASAEIRSLEEERLGSIELLHTADLALGRHADAIPRLAALATEYPYREKLHALLIRALYRSGRQAEALATFQDLRRKLRDELGIEPSPELVALETDVLLQSDALQTAPTLDRGAARREDLPAQLTPFIGRVLELTQVSALIERDRLVTVAGTGGSGKTRLAIEVVSQLPTTLVDSVAFVDLATVTDPSLVDLAVLTAVGASEASQRTARDVLVEHVIDRRQLIVLDSCEHVARAAASIAGHLLSNTAGVRVLATSQQVLKLPGETVYPLPPMGTSSASGDPAEALSCDAARLFLDHSQRARPGFVPSESEAVHIASIVRDLDGIPLGIELAAARTRTMTVADVHARLSQRLRLLTGGSSAMRRQQTLEAAVGWSYELTQGRERNLFDCLSIFTGSFTYAAAADVGEIADHIDAIELLGRLVDKSLIAVDAAGDEIRYRLLETIRLFASARLEERGDARAVADRHATHYLNLASHGNELLKGSDQGMWQRRFRQSTPDFRVALERAIEHRPDDALSAVANGLGYFWWREGSYAEGTAWLQRALAAASHAPSRDRAGALKLLAATTYFGGSVDEARRAGVQAAAMAREVGDPALLCAALSMVGVSSWDQGLLSEAIASFEEAVDITVSSGEPVPAAVLWNIGISYLDLADLGGAEKTAQRLRDAQSPGGDPLLFMNADFLQCNIAIVHGELEAARSLAESALARANDLDRRVDIAEVHERLAEIGGLQGDLASVDRHLAQADALRGDMSPKLQSRANLVRARRARAVGDLDDARASLRLVLPVALERQHPAILSLLFHETSLLAFRMGDLVDAATLTGAVERIARPPEVTLAAFAVDQARALRAGLRSSLGSDEAEGLIRRGATSATSEALDTTRRCLG
jgi:predicted ATPase/DNA-binding SARP family transcriptional activator